MRFVLVFNILLILFQLHEVCSSSHHASVPPDQIQDIDLHVHYGSILPFHDEWKNFKFPDEHFHPSQIQFWFRCIGREVRAYFMIEDMRRLSHGKEADMPINPHIQDRIKIFADNKPVSYRNWFAGGDMFFTIPEDTPRDHYVDITIAGMKHFTRFPVSKCTPEVVPTADTKYTMHIHLREYLNSTNINRRALEGVAKHLAYHRCLVSLDSYEIVVQRDQVPIYMQNHHIAKAVEHGWLKFIIRNPVNPPPMNVPSGDSSNCYYQAYTENLAILRHWKENTKMYFFDSDEYLYFPNEMTKEKYFDMLSQHKAVGFDRYMTFCTSCPRDRAELKQLSFSNSKYAEIKDKLQHPKLVVDPNAVGCYIVHWAGCGEETHVVPKEFAHISHFENLYTPRWRKSKEELEKEPLFVPTKAHQICDPSLYDWKQPLPSYF